ncbi:MAG: cysteine desulfurase family protein [Bdellovibrionales bacterium]
MEIDVSNSFHRQETPLDFEGVSPFYCDYNATTPIPSKLIRATSKIYASHWFNLSAPYGSANDENQWMNQMRYKFSALSGDREAKVVFCASSTEAINQAIYSLSLELGSEGKIVISDIEHSAVRAAAEKWFSNRVVIISAKQILSGDFSEVVRITENAQSFAVFIQAGNNETGVILPLTELRKHISGHRLIVDASQVFGKNEDFVDQLSIADGAIISPHKFYGPKGVGVLIWKKSLGTLHPLIVGGGQEHGLRSGTENTPALYLTNLWLQSLPEIMEAFSPVSEFCSAFEKHLTEHCPNAKVVGSEYDRLRNTTAICFSGVLSDHIVPALDYAGISASSGSACNYGTQEPSRSYLSLGLSWDDARCVIRFSFGCPNLKTTPTTLADNVTQVIKKVSG